MLTPTQWDKIWTGLAGMGLATTIMADQLINALDRPLIAIRVVSEGIPITKRQYLGEEDIEGEDDLTLKQVTYGQICKARISALIESLDLADARLLVSQFITKLDQEELRINPHDDRMQYRGCEPADHPPPYSAVRLKKLIQRFSVDFFVEYWYTWTVDYDIIDDVDIDYEHLGS
ncbi:MAG: hypothetical protein ACYDG4_15110 [Desulfuromonadaceae bacterium]